MSGVSVCYWIWKRLKNNLAKLYIMVGYIARKFDALLDRCFSPVFFFVFVFSILSTDMMLNSYHEWWNIVAILFREYLNVFCLTVYFRQDIINELACWNDQTVFGLFNFHYMVKTTRMISTMVNNYELENCILMKITWSNTK